VRSRLCHTLFWFVTALFLQANAYAKSTIGSFSYSDKTETIRLAKAGDAEAFYRLGLSHLNGVNAVQSNDLAQRFFFYAAEKGHIDAKQYLIRLTPAQDAPKIIKPAKSKKHPATQLRKPQTMASEVKGEKAVQATLVTQAETITPNVNSKKTETKPDAVILPTRNTTPKVQPVTQAKAEPNPVKLALETEPTRKPSPFVKEAKPKPLWKYILYAICLIGICIIGLLIYSLIKGYRQTNEILPDDFNRRTYFKLNPDVKSSGMNAAMHYIKHGQYEDRPYR